jgi:hypothetical protein
LPPTYRTFLEHHGSLIVRAEGLSLPEDAMLNVLDAQGAALWTDDLEKGLVDHRPFEWPFDDLSSFGIDRCVVFSVTERWIDGWAFDTRVVGPTGELAIRRLYDFTADQGKAMANAWPADDGLGGDRATTFVDWLDARVSALIAHAPLAGP